MRPNDAALDRKVRLQIHGSDRSGPDAVTKLAHEITTEVRHHTGIQSYRWSRDPQLGTWIIEEEYEDGPAFSAHMRWMASSGYLRTLGKALKVDRVVLLSGDQPLVAAEIGPLPISVYSVVDSL